MHLAHSPTLIAERRRHSDASAQIAGWCWPFLVFGNAEVTAPSRSICAWPRTGISWLARSVMP